MATLMEVKLSRNGERDKWWERCGGKELMGWKVLGWDGDEPVSRFEITIFESCENS